MRESTTYMAILDEGREEEVKDNILRLGRKKLGHIIEAMLTRLKGMIDLERLHRILDRLLNVTSWQDLLDTP